MLAHTSGPYLPEIFRYVFTGMPAVIVFFVISGFCIHYPYVASPLPVQAFYCSRLMRILPVALLGIALARISGHPDLPGFSFTGQYILWSVNCELWYYFLYPAFYYLSRFISWRRLLLISFLIYAVLIYLKPGDQSGNLHYAYSWKNLWLIGLPAWLAGCVLAQELPLFQRIIGTCSHRWLWRLAAASSASLLCWLTLNSPIKYYYSMNLFALLVVFWVAVEIAASRKELAPGIWDWIGKWSYSIYIFHEICRVYLQMAGINSWIKLPLILAGCYLAYLVVELPSHKAAKALFRKSRHMLRISTPRGALA